MKYLTTIKTGILAALCCLAGCKEEALVAEVPAPGEGNSVPTGETRFVLPDAEGTNAHIWNGEDIQFELRRGTNDDKEITAAFDTSEETLDAMTAKYAEMKGINLPRVMNFRKQSYSLQASSRYPLQ